MPNKPDTFPATYRTLSGQRRPVILITKKLAGLAGRFRPDVTEPERVTPFNGAPTGRAKARARKANKAARRSRRVNRGR